MFDKSLHPDCIEGPLGTPMKDDVARAVEALMKSHPDAAKEGIVKFATPADVSVENDRTEVSKITTEGVDKDREVVIAKGIDLSAFTPNPVVLLNHNWNSLPLGKCLWIKDHSNGLTAKTQYAKRPSNHQGEWTPESVYELIKQGMMPGKSIGFLTLEARSPTKAEVATRPEWKDVRRVLSKTLLVEYSVATVPSNHEALVQVVGKSFPGLATLLGIEEKAVDDLPEDDRMELVRKIAEAFPDLAELQEVVAFVKTLMPQMPEVLKDVGALKVGIRDVRQALIRVKAQPKPASGPSFLEELGRQLRKAS